MGPRRHEVAKNTRAILTIVVLLVPVLAYAQAVQRQAVIETTAGAFVIDLLPDVAPNQVAHFIALAEKGEYDGTTFHRMVRMGMIQGGDPISRDPARRAEYGTGGLNAVKAESRAAALTRGAVAAVLIPNRPDSAGAQFFVVIVDQPSLANQFTVFARVSDGMEVVQQISAAPVEGDGRALERVEIRRVTIRDAPPPEVDPFTTASVADLAAQRAILDTSLGPITVEFFPEKAPGHVRQFLRLAAAGIYDGMAFHRVVPGFVVQTGSLTSRQTPLTSRQQERVVQQPPEFNDTPHDRGILSMARGDDPGSATTSFFICLAPAPTLDGQYTAFGRVVDGMSVVEAIEAAPRTGETPNERIELRGVRLIR